MIAHLFSLSALARICGIFIFPLVMLVGCTDTRRNEVDGLIQNSIPDGLRIEKIDPRFVIKSQADGSHTAEVPVYYRVTADHYHVERLVSTPRGKILARAIDETAQWATQNLRQDDPVHTEIIRIRNSIASNTLLLDRTMKSDEEVAAVLTISWMPDTPSPEGQITSGLPKVNGQILPDPQIQMGILAGSSEAQAAIKALQHSLDKMEHLRAEWISTRDLKTATARQLWMGAFVPGAGFLSDDERLLVLRGLENHSAAEWVITSGQDPIKTIRMIGKADPIYAGGMNLRVTEAYEIQPGEPGEISKKHPLPEISQATLSLADPQTLTLTMSNGQSRTMRFDHVADMLPPE